MTDGPVVIPDEDAPIKTDTKPAKESKKLFFFKKKKKVCFQLTTLYV